MTGCPTEPHSVEGEAIISLARASKISDVIAELRDHGFLALLNGYDVDMQEIPVLPDSQRPPYSDQSGPSRYCRTL